MTTERDVLTVRLPADMHEELRAYKFFTGRPINDAVVGLIRDFLDGPARQEIEHGMTRRAESMYGGALAKLAEM